MPTINDSECWAFGSRRTGRTQELHGWHNHDNLSLHCILFDIGGEGFFSHFLGSPPGPSHLGLGPLIISLFFITLPLRLFCFPPGTLSNYDHPWNQIYAQGFKCLEEYTAKHKKEGEIYKYSIYIQFIEIIYIFNTFKYIQIYILLHYLCCFSSLFVWYFHCETSQRALIIIGLIKYYWFCIVQQKYQIYTYEFNI